jgi:predicted nucleic acid-binding protein
VKIYSTWNPSIIFFVPQLTGIVCEDPDDDKFLTCALASGTNLVVSGDRRLLTASGRKEVEVMKPHKFIDKYLS